MITDYISERDPGALTDAMNKVWPGPRWLFDF